MTIAKKPTNDSPLTIIPQAQTRAWGYSLLLPDLCYLTGNYEGCRFAVGVCNRELGFAGTAGADSNRKSDAVFDGSIFFDEIHLDGMKGENLQRKKHLMATSDGVSIVCIDELPRVGRLTRGLLDHKGEFVDAIGE